MNLQVKYNEIKAKFEKVVEDYNERYECYPNNTYDCAVITIVKDDDGIDCMVGSDREPFQYNYLTVVKQWDYLPTFEEFKECWNNNSSLQDQYNEWRNTGISESEGTDIPFTWDAGEASARADFAEWAGLDDISFEEMKELEENY